MGEPLQHPLTDDPIAAGRWRAALADRMARQARSGHYQRQCREGHAVSAQQDCCSSHVPVAEGGWWSCRCLGVLPTS